MRGTIFAAGLLSAVLLAGAMSAAGLQPVPVSDDELSTAIGQLGDFDYGVRTGASGLVRRAPEAQARTALAEAVSSHEDEYVRFRALVLLVGFGGREAEAAVLEAVADPNDRLRAACRDCCRRKKLGLVCLVTDPFEPYSPAGP